MKKYIATLLATILVCGVRAQSVWTADRGDGTYRNPVLFADYSDPDVIRTGDDYWMTSSSFNCTPGLQILHSTDLVNWRIVGAALSARYDEEASLPSHGNCVWAPAIRWHDGRYYIYWGDPDRGIYCVTADDPCGAWSQPRLVKAGRGMIDPCPLWDDDGRVWLVHGWAGSRAGFKSVLSVFELSADGQSPVGEEVLVFDGHDDHPTVEGPKFYKRNGWYYIFAPAGGVKTGWQLVLRSRSPYGPYECRTVLHQGDGPVNGPHQGAWVEDTAGDSWFLHFVDMYAYGRVVHLQPMRWTEDDWCVIGADDDGDGTGEPVPSWRKPSSRRPASVEAPAADDRFDDPQLGLQWQWHARPEAGWYFTNPAEGRLRLNCVVQPEGWRNQWDTPNLLLQKVPAPDCCVTTRVRLHASYEGDRGGLIVMGEDYATLGPELRDGSLRMVLRCCRAAHEGEAEQVVVRNLDEECGELWLRCVIRRGQHDNGTPAMYCSFSYSTDGRRFIPLGERFEAAAGRWIGAKIGLWALAERKKNDGGRLDVDSFFLEPVGR